MSVYAKQAANLNNNFELPNKIYAEYISFAWFNPKTNVFCLPNILSETKNLKFSEKSQPLSPFFRSSSIENFVKPDLSAKMLLT